MKASSRYNHLFSLARPRSVQGWTNCVENDTSLVRRDPDITRSNLRGFLAVLAWDGWRRGVEDPRDKDQAERYNVRGGVEVEDRVE